jgi:hypothetical protein
MPLKTVPAKACQFAADLQVRVNSDDSKTAPITLVARSGEAVCHWYWGNVVHDLGGMTLAKPRIPLDYCHDDDEVIGYANKFDTSTGELVATGALIPYSPDPEDKATEIIYKAQQGVPYEASIFFDGPLVVEEVSENATTFVNGEEMSGPITVIRQWTLRGIAVCPYGNDPNTSAAMKFSRGGDVPAQVISQEKHEMSATAEAEAKEAAAVEAEATSDKPAEVVGVLDENGEEPTTVDAETAGTQTDDPAAAGEPQPPAESAEEQPVPEVAPVEATAMSEGMKFLNAFGDQGGVWFAQGKTFEEAQALHFAAVVTQRDRLAKENEELKVKLTASRGEKTPLSFSPDPLDQAKPPLKNTGNLSSGLAKFAASINFKK